MQPSKEAAQPGSCTPGQVSSSNRNGMAAAEAGYTVPWCQILSCKSAHAWSRTSGSWDSSDRSSSGTSAAGPWACLSDAQSIVSRPSSIERPPPSHAMIQWTGPRRWGHVHRRVRSLGDGANISNRARTSGSPTMPWRIGPTPGFATFISRCVRIPSPAGPSWRSPRLPRVDVPHRIPLGTPRPGSLSYGCGPRSSDRDRLPQGRRGRSTLSSSSYRAQGSPKGECRMTIHPGRLQPDPRIHAR